MSPLVLCMVLRLICVRNDFENNRISARWASVGRLNLSDNSILLELYFWRALLIFLPKITNTIRYIKLKIKILLLSQSVSQKEPPIRELFFKIRINYLIDYLLGIMSMITVRL